MPMGKMNLLKANYTGSVGATTGAEVHGASVVKAKIWSKAPASPLQRSNVRAFEALNRVCGVMARNWSAWVPVKKGNMLLHNALARYFKAVVAGHVFDVAGFKEHVTGTSSILVSDFEFDASTGSLRFTASASLHGFENGTESWCIIVVDTAGRILHWAQPRATVYSFDAVVPALDSEVVYTLCFASERKGAGNVLTAFSAGASVFDGVWFPLLVDSVSKCWLEGNVLHVESEGARYEDGAIIFPEG